MTSLSFLLLDRVYGSRVSELQESKKPKNETVLWIIPGIFNTELTICLSLEVIINVN